eukprot:scaffold11127_cov55-Phaeocystis_antarctica.AAC.5
MFRWSFGSSFGWQRYPPPNQAARREELFHSLHRRPKNRRQRPLRTMGFVPDNSHMRNQYACGSMWRPGSASQPVVPSMFPTPGKGTPRPCAGFTRGWREQVQHDRTKKERGFQPKLASSQRKLERRIVDQEFQCLDRNLQSHALLARQRLDRQRHLSTGMQRHEQHRFEHNLAHNAIKRPSDQLVETRNPPTMVIAGRLDGLGCAWFNPRPDPVAPFAIPRDSPYSPMKGMKPEARPLPKILTVSERLNFEEGYY